MSDGVRGSASGRAGAAPRQPAARQPAARQPAARQPAARQVPPRQAAPRQGAQGKAAPRQGTSGKAAPRQGGQGAKGKATPRQLAARQAAPARTAPQRSAAPRAAVDPGRAPVPRRGAPAGRAPAARAGGPPRRPPARPRLPRRPRRPPDPGRRLRFALLVLLFVLTLFGGRLVQLQGLDGPALASEAQRQRTATKTLPAHRGDIVDASNATLATTVDRPDLQVDQTLVGKYKKVVAGHEVVLGIPGAARELSAVLGLPQSVITQRLTGRSKGAILARGVSPDVARKVLRLLIPGVDMVQASKRIYPSGKLAANVLGFVSTADGHAMEGIERALDGQLSGSAGWLRYERALDRAGTPIPTGYTQEQDPRPGQTVQLTLVQDLQWQAEQALQAAVRSTGAQSADAVIMDAKTFKVLALATAPTFDPNSYGTARASDLGDRPLLDAFEPGSTAKVITMAAALEEKVATPTTKVVVPPVLRRADREFHDAEDHGTEHLTVAGVLAQSSNIGTILTGEQVPARTMDDYLHRFGVGSPTGVGLPESSGVLAPYQKWSDSQRYTVMFGQGMSMTALQATTVFATIANDGIRLQPQLVAGTRDADGTFHPQARAPGVRAVSADTARQVRAMLENVVGHNGTAEKAAVPGYRVAGKTGTAQAVSDGAYTSSFIGMAPADDPALVVAVVLHQPTVGHFGGEVAAPVFQQLMTAALFERKVPPTGTKPDEIPLQWR